MKKICTLILCTSIFLSLCCCRNENNSLESSHISSTTDIHSEISSVLSIETDNSPSEVSTSSIEQPINSILNSIQEKVTSVQEPVASSEPPQPLQPIKEDKMPGYETYTYVPLNPNHEYPEYEQRYFNFINEKRQKAGLEAFLWNETLYECTKARADELQYLYSTNRPDGHSDALTIYSEYGFNPQFVSQLPTQIPFLNDISKEIERTIYQFDVMSYMWNNGDVSSAEYKSITIASIISTKDMGTEGNTPYIYSIITFLG